MDARINAHTESIVLPGRRRIPCLELSVCASHLFSFPTPKGAAYSAVCGPCHDGPLEGLLLIKSAKNTRRTPKTPGGWRSASISGAQRSRCTASASLSRSSAAACRLWSPQTIDVRRCRISVAGAANRKKISGNDLNALEAAFQSLKCGCGSVAVCIGNCS